MTDNFACLIDLLACGASGNRATNIHGAASWDAVLRLAEEQSVYYIILHAIKGIEDCSLEENRKAFLLMELKNAIISEFSKRLKVIALLERFEVHGIRAILLKGYVAASQYNSPDIRISADTDIYVEVKDELAAQKILVLEGFTILPREKSSHHTVCKHSDVGDLELHTSFYDEIVDKIWFRNLDSNQYIEEPFEKVVTADGAYYTLGKTDNLIFLALHMIKHFISQGMSLRQTMDFALFYNAYEKELNLSRFWDVMQKLEYSYFIRIVIEISREYFHLPIQYTPGKEKVRDTDIMAVLEDMEKGGSSKNKDMDARILGTTEYNHIKLTNDKGRSGFYLYQFGWYIRMFFSALFPSPQRLAVKFPYVKKSVLLIPIAWVHRLCTRGVTYLRGVGGKRDTREHEDLVNDIVRQRIALFKRAKMI